MRRHYLLLLLSLFLLLNAGEVNGQSDKKTSKSKAAQRLFTEGLNFYNNSLFKHAYQSFDEATRKDDSFAEAWMMKGECAFALGDYPLAADHFRIANDKAGGLYPIGHILAGSAYYLAGDYAKSMEAYTQYLHTEKPKDNLLADAKKGIKQSAFAQHAMANPVPFTPHRLSENINTRIDEYWPSLTADEQTILYTALVPGKEEINEKLQEDFFASKLANGEWQPAYNLGKPVNTNGNEGAQALAPDGRTIYYTACNRADGYGQCDLYDALWTGQRWELPRNLGSPVNTSRSEKNPSIAHDGQTLWFTSDRPGGFGQMDIWYTRRQPDGNWGIPENAGDSINTDGNEISPFIHPDNRTLYYASDGKLGMGKFDIFICRLDSSGKPLSVSNLGYPINTNRDEIGLFVTTAGTRAYYSSDIESGNQDIYWFEMPEATRPLPVSYCKAWIFDSKTRVSLKVDYILTSLPAGDTLVKGTTNEADGTFLVCLPADKDYGLHIARQGYLFHSENFSLKGIKSIKEPFELEVGLNRPEVGQSVTLNNIFLVSIPTS